MDVSLKRLPWGVPQQRRFMGREATTLGAAQHPLIDWKTTGAIWMGAGAVIAVIGLAKK